MSKACRLGTHDGPVSVDNDMLHTIAKASSDTRPKVRSDLGNVRRLAKNVIRGCSRGVQLERGQVIVHDATLLQTRSGHMISNELGHVLTKSRNAPADFTKLV